MAFVDEAAHHAGLGAVLRYRLTAAQIREDLGNTWALALSFTPSTKRCFALDFAIQHVASWRAPQGRRVRAVAAYTILRWRTHGRERMHAAEAALRYIAKYSTASEARNNNKQILVGAARKRMSMAVQASSCAAAAVTQSASSSPTRGVALTGRERESARPSSRPIIGPPPLDPIQSLARPFVPPPHQRWELGRHVQTPAACRRQRHKRC